MSTDTDRAIAALQAIPPDLPREDWVKLGMSAKSAGIDFDTFHAWSAAATNYKNERDVQSVWNSIRRTDGVTVATIYKTAAGHGHRPGTGKPQHHARAIKTRSEPPRKVASGLAAAEVWSRCKPAPADHPSSPSRASPMACAWCPRVTCCARAVRIGPVLWWCR